MVIVSLFVWLILLYLGCLVLGCLVPDLLLEGSIFYIDLLPVEDIFIVVLNNHHLITSCPRKKYRIYVILDFFFM
jgi:hypothetical protein